LEKIEMTHARSRQAKVAGSLTITGHTGSGKSTIKTEYMSRFSNVETLTGTVIPVLAVDTPSTPTVRSLASAILEALGDPISYRGTTEEKTVRLYKLMRGCQVELLILDEFQHFVDRAGSNESRKAADWLKNVINALQIPVVIMGLPRCLQILNGNEQLKRRFSRHYSLLPFSNEPESFDEFRSVLDIIQQAFPIPCVSLSDFEMAKRFLFASYGLIDFIVKVMDGAIEIAVHRNLESIEMHTLAMSFNESVWHECPPELNPFNTGTKLRHLTKSQEPFEFINQ
jgi:hypothetical protein